MLCCYSKATKGFLRSPLRHMVPIFWKPMDAGISAHIETNTTNSQDFDQDFPSTLTPTMQAAAAPLGWVGPCRESMYRDPERSMQAAERAPLSFIHQQKTWDTQNRQQGTHAGQALGLGVVSKSRVKEEGRERGGLAHAAHPSGHRGPCSLGPSGVSFCPLLSAQPQSYAHC